MHANAQTNLDVMYAHGDGRGSAEPKLVAEKQTVPVAGQPWENTLGMKFVPVPGTEVIFSIWDMRVQDFEAFVRASGHDATAGMLSRLKLKNFGVSRPLDRRQKLTPPLSERRL